MARQNIVVKRYKSEKEYMKDANRMAKQGYVVDNVVTEEKGRGCLKWGLFGIFAVLFKPKHEMVVTYKLVEAKS